MIIQLRGTSGSGKSTAIRKVMEETAPWNPVCIEGRKRPLYYIHWLDRVTILGHYETACGGCDTIGSARAVYDLTMKLAESGETIIAEGLLLSEDVKWTSLLPEVRVLFLTTPLPRCLTQIEGRRKEVGNEKPLDPTNTSNRVRVIERARLKLIEKGIDCRRCSPEQAPWIILNWARLHAGERKV